MVFVLLAYGGWNEAAYLGAELMDARRNMVRALLLLDSIPKPDDAADALAIAITHLNTRRYE